MSYIIIYMIRKLYTMCIGYHLILFSKLFSDCKSLQYKVDGKKKCFNFGHGAFKNN